ncbi:DUF2783 domain-containing protein [Variovorax sp. VNK109]|jgi:hypothetical protein|uniref:DUF2783 domain-containing protein n=1 Tax=Variovorax sp. VNK109 TaxID=3400919 RepID=UPI003C10F457
MNSPKSIKSAPNLKNPDAFYELLLDAHKGLDRDQSELLNARLILLMANQIGDDAVLAACIGAARDVPGFPAPDGTPSSPPTKAMAA